MSARTPSRVARLARPTAVLAWAMAAALAGSVVWWAVAAIGSEQGAAPTVFTQEQVARLADQPRPVGATATPSGTASPGAMPTADPTVVPEPTAAATPTPTPSGTPRPRPVPDPPSATVPPVASPPAAPAPAVVARTWNVAGGQVAAECRGAAIVLLAATPENTWSVEVKHSGPAEIEVEFRQGEDETSVHAVCVAGVPEMAAEAEDEHD